MRKKIISINDDWIKMTTKIFMSSRLLIETKIIVIMSSSFAVRLEKKKNRKTIFVVFFSSMKLTLKEKKKNRKTIFVVFFFSMIMSSIKKKKIRKQSLLISSSIEFRRRRHCRRHLSILSRSSSRNHFDRFRRQFSEVLR